MAESRGMIVTIIAVASMTRFRQRDDYSSILGNEMNNRSASVWGRRRPGWAGPEILL